MKALPLPSALRSALRTGGARVISMPVSIATTLVAARITVSATGVTAYGAISVVGLLITLLPFADLGLGGGVTTAAARYKAQPESALLRIVAGVRVTLFSAVVITVTALILFVSGAWDTLLGGTTSRALPHSAAAATAVLCLFAPNVPLTLGLRVLVGRHRAATATLFGLVTSCANVCYVASCAALHAPAAWFALAPVLSTLLTNFLLARLALLDLGLTVRELIAAVVRVSTREAFRSSRSTAVPLLAITLLGPISFQTDRIVLSQQSNAMEVAKYALIAPFYATLTGLMYTAATALWPHFVQADSARGLRRAFAGSTLAFAGTGLIAGAGLALLSEPVAGLISPRFHDFDLSLKLGFGALVAAQAAALPAQMLLTRGRAARDLAFAMAAATALNVSLSIALAPTWGASGPVWASVIATTFIQLPAGVGFALRYSDVLSAHKDEPLLRRASN